MERKNILEKIQDIVGQNSSLSSIRGKRLIFCPVCSEAISEGNDQPGQKILSCYKCGYYGDHAFIFDDSVKFQFFQENGNLELLHFSAGVVIKNPQNRYLLFQRALFPVGKFTISAGHIELSDLDPQDAAIREVNEETGLFLDKTRLAELGCLPILIQESCRRCANYHKWFIYQYLYDGMYTLKTRTYENCGDIRFYSRDEIRKLDLTEPTRQFFSMLKII